MTRFHVSLGRLLPSRGLVDLVCILVITAVSAFMLGDVLLGVRPTSYDHNTHFTRIWLFWSELLSSGSIHGWTHSWFAGYPLNYFYPFISDLYILAVRGLSFGYWQLGEAYAVGFGAFFIIRNLVIYWVGRSVGARSVGLVAALLCTLDVGAPRLGGWLYSIWAGVWIQEFASIFALAAFVVTDRLLKTGSLRLVGALAILVALALASHPIEIIYFPVFFGLAGLWHWLAVGQAGFKNLAKMLASFALGISGALFWLLPFAAYKYFAERNWDGGAPPSDWAWLTLDSLGDKLMRGSVMESPQPLIDGMAFLGAVMLCLSPTFAKRLAGSLVLAFLLLGSNFLVDTLGMEFLRGFFDHIIFRRFGMLVKPFWFVAAAYCLVIAAKPIWSWRPGEKVAAKLGRGARQRQIATAVCLGILLVPFGWTMVRSFVRTDRSMRARLTLAGDQVPIEDKQKLSRWLNEQARASSGFFRVATALDRQEDVALRPLLVMPVYETDFTPASEFRYKVDSKAQAALQATNVRFLIANHKDKAAGDGFRLAASFGNLDVYELLEWNPTPYRLISGDADVRVEQWSRERIVLSAADGAKGELRVNVSYFPGWHAYQNGREVEIKPETDPLVPRSGFMTMPIEAGRIELEFRRGWIEYLGYLASLIAFVVSGALLVSPRSRGKGEEGAAVAP